jgi:hypothetical protein
MNKIPTLTYNRANIIIIMKVIPVYHNIVLDQHDELDFYSASSLKQLFRNRHVALLDTFSRFRNQLVLIALLNVVYPPEK